MLRWLRHVFRSRSREDAMFHERLRRLVDSGYCDQALHVAVPYVESAAPQQYADVQSFDYDHWIARLRTELAAAKLDNGPA